MSTNRAVLALAILAVFAAFAHAQVPASAQIDGITNSAWPDGVSDVSSFGQLVMKASPTVTSTDVIVRSGIATEALWVPTKGGTLLPHVQFASNGPLVDAARMCGAGYQVCFGKGGSAGWGTQRNADGITVFKTEEDAVTALKTRIAAGAPVQAYLDMYDVWDEVAAQEPGWAAKTKAHVGHFVAVTGYDAGSVYFADNGPRDVLGDNSDRVHVSWGAFRLAWLDAGKLAVGKLRAGPYYMLYITSGPRMTLRNWTVAWLGVKAQRTPADMRKAAIAMRKSGSKPATILVNASLMANLRPWAAVFAGWAGEPSVSSSYNTSSTAWKALCDNPGEAAAPATLEEIASTEESALNTMRSRAGAVAPICALYPDGANVATLGRTPLRFIPIPDVTKIAVEISMTNNFNAGKPATYIPKLGNPVVILTDNDWLKLLPKSDGSRRLSWRVRGYRGYEQVVSQVRTMTWNAMAMAQSGPDANSAISVDALPTFTWQAPTLTLRPRVALSTDGNFANAKTRSYIPAKRGSTSATMSKALYLSLVRRDDGDGVIYWRVEDASAKITTVQPSATRTLRLPQQ